MLVTLPQVAEWSTMINMSICLYMNISLEPRIQNSPDFLCILPADMSRFSSGRISMLCTSGFVNEVIFSHNGPYGTGDAIRCKPSDSPGGSMELITTKYTRIGAGLPRLSWKKGR